MAYADVAAAALPTDPPTPTSAYARVQIGLIKQAMTRAVQITTGDQREWPVVTKIIDGSHPSSWVVTVLGLLDIANALTPGPPTDAQIDAQVTAAWPRFIAIQQR